ncbi:MAG: helix-turn-helix transcriptional regulator [Clostridia bacterium]|nr:helix-turn-helix transcriptional regulator [Clostridia bacterium]
MDTKDFKQVVAQNIYYLRTINHLTQFELGQKLNYSDKAISKWERGDAVPDAYVLLQMSELFGVTVDYILTEHKEQDKKVETKPKSRIKGIILVTALVGIFALATLIYVLLAFINIYHWQIFIYAVPVCAIVAIVLASVWFKGKGVLIYTSVLGWSLLATVFFAVASVLGYGNGLWMVFLIGIPLQIIVFLVFGIKITVTISKKDNPSWIKSIKSKKKDKVDENQGQDQ